MSRKYTLYLCYRWNEAESVGGGCWRKNDRILNGFSGDLSCTRRERLTVGPKLRVYVVLLGRGYRERKRWDAQIIDAWFLHPSLIAALEFTRIDTTMMLPTCSEESLEVAIYFLCIFGILITLSFFSGVAWDDARNWSPFVQEPPRDLKRPPSSLGIFPDYPPNYTEWHKIEEVIPWHNKNLMFPEGKEGRYVISQNTSMVRSSFGL